MNVVVVAAPIVNWLEQLKGDQRLHGILDALVGMHKFMNASNPLVAATEVETAFASTADSSIAQAAISAIRVADVAKIDKARALISAFTAKPAAAAAAAATPVAVRCPAICQSMTLLFMVCRLDCLLPFLRLLLRLLLPLSLLQFRSTSPRKVRSALVYVPHLFRWRACIADGIINFLLKHENDALANKMVLRKVVTIARHPSLRHATEEAAKFVRTRATKADVDELLGYICRFLRRKRERDAAAASNSAGSSVQVELRSLRLHAYSRVAEHQETSPR